MWIVPTDNAYIAAMTMWLPNLEGRKGPVYRAIADAIDGASNKALFGRVRACRRIGTSPITSGSP